MVEDRSVANMQQNYVLRKYFRSTQFLWCVVLNNTLLVALRITCWEDSCKLGGACTLERKGETWSIWSSESLDRIPCSHIKCFKGSVDVYLVKVIWFKNSWFLISYVHIILFNLYKMIFLIGLKASQLPKFDSVFSVLLCVFVVIFSVINTRCNKQCNNN